MAESTGEPVQSAYSTMNIVARKWGYPSRPRPGRPSTTASIRKLVIRSAPSDTLGGRCLTAVAAVATEWGVISRQRPHMVWAWLDSVFAWQQVAALS
jgi:hypothetical protein